MSAWTFEGADGLSSHLAALGFAAAGNPAIAVAEEQSDTYNLSSLNGFEETLTFTCPTLTAGLLCFTFVCSGANVAVEDFNFSYGGLPAQINAVVIQETELDVIHVTGYVLIGPSADLENNDFVTTVFGLGGGTVVSCALDFVFVEGIDQNAVPDEYEAGTVDVFDSPLSVTIAEGTGFVFAGAAAADLGETPVLTSTTTGYIQGAAQISTSQGTTALAYYFCDTSYNCECDTDPEARTLSSMRTELLMRTGYASQATNPPPGVAALFDSYLQSAQRYLWHRYTPLQTRRMFSWELVPGTRYYALPDHLQCCAAALSRYRIEGAWVQDPNNTWWPLVYGIEPTFYTLDQNLGWPNYYEIRQCIEVFPAPQETGCKLWIKGGMALLPFTDDDDTTTIDAGPVFDWALGLAKSHKGDRDAGVPIPGRETGYYGMAIRQIKDLIAHTHVNRRYVPGTAALPIPTPPVMVHFDA